MKKINLILGGALTALMIAQSCQQPAADQAAIDAKVTEAYNAEKMKVENEAATACEDAINAQVKLVQDSLSHMSAKAQADLLAKTQRELKLAQGKADAMKKKALANAKKKAVPAVKTQEQIKKEVVTKEINDINKRLGDERELKPAPQKEIDAINDRLK